MNAFQLQGEDSEGALQGQALSRQGGQWANPGAGEERRVWKPDLSPLFYSGSEGRSFLCQELGITGNLTLRPLQVHPGLWLSTLS